MVDSMTREQDEDGDWADNSGYSHIELYPDGTYKSFVPEIDTEWAIGGRYVKLKADCVVRFFPSGNLELCLLCADTAMDAFGVAVLIAGGAPLQFHPNGSPRNLTLAAQSRWPFQNKKWTYRGTAYEPNTRLEFSEDGAIVSSKKE